MRRRPLNLTEALLRELAFALIEEKEYIRSKEDMMKVADVAWDLLIKAYAPLPGGFKTARDIDHLVSKSHIWTLVKKEGEVIALRVYKQAHGLKGIASATNGTKEGKDALRSMIKKGLKKSWAEISGPMERFVMRLGGEKYKVPSEKAQDLIGAKHPILSYDDDGFHYTRAIRGTKFRKIIVGSPDY